MTPYGVAILCLMAAAPVRANPGMSADYERMMGWLADEVVEGLSFNAGSTFDPPNEIRPWHVQPDISLGIGMIPLNKGKFPKIETPALAAKKPENLLPNRVSFPNLALHMRLGLPRRFDLTLRGANMTVPKGYQLAPGTSASGQSNSIGFGLRKHFMGGNRPLVSVAGNYNHVKGYFNFLNDWQRIEMTPGIQIDTRNIGRLEWNVNSFGANTVISQSYGIWTPFCGLGWNYMTGSMKARLQTDWASPIGGLPPIGEASAHPEQHQARVIVGTQLDRSRFSFFVNGEMKAIGVQAGHAFIFQVGVVTPFRIGSSAIYSKGTKRMNPTMQLAREDFDLDEGERVYLHNAPANLKPSKVKKPKKKRLDPEEEEYERERRSSAWLNQPSERKPLYDAPSWDYRQPREKARPKGDMPELIFIQ